MIAQLGPAIIAPPLDQAAKGAKPTNPVAKVPGAKMAENFAKGGGAPMGPAKPEKAESPLVVKYIPSYALAVLAAEACTIACASSWTAPASPPAAASSSALSSAGSRPTSRIRWWPARPEAASRCLSKP